MKCRVKVFQFTDKTTLYNKSEFECLVEHIVVLTEAIFNNWSGPNPTHTFDSKFSRKLIPTLNQIPVQAPGMSL